MTWYSRMTDRMCLKHAVTKHQTAAIRTVQYVQTSRKNVKATSMKEQSGPKNRRAIKANKFTFCGCCFGFLCHTKTSAFVSLILFIGGSITESHFTNDVIDYSSDLTLASSCSSCRCGASSRRRRRVLQR